MNIKQIFGVFLTVVGALGLIYGFSSFVDMPDGARDVKVLVIYGVVGALFLMAGIGFIRISKNEL